MSQSRRASTGSFHILTIAGIPIRLHFTFVLFMVFAVSSQSRAPQLAWLLPAIFGCVVLHELGHALTAKRFGIRTREITLYLIGGVAFIEGRPKPAQEFWIALAGPLVNVAIALIIYPFLVAKEGTALPLSWSLEGSSFLRGLFLSNVFLPLFNMIPALPMDGGRVLRALLAMRMGERRATQVAASIGQMLAVAAAVYGVYSQQIILLLIAVFVFLGAGQEVASSIGHSLVSGKKIGDAMMTTFATIGSGEPLSKAADLLLQSSQQEFPVVWGEEVLGLLSRDDIVRGIAQNGPSEYVAGHMRRDFRKLPPGAPLEDAMQLFSDDRSAVLVMDDERLIGMLTIENLGEFMMLEQVRSRQAS